MTKRFFIWAFWYFIASAVATRTVFQRNDGTLSLPLWWGSGGLLVLFAWWTRFLVVKYPSRSRLIYGAVIALGVLLALGAVSEYL